MPRVTQGNALVARGFLSDTSNSVLHGEGLHLSFGIVFVSAISVKNAIVQFKNR